MADEAELTPAPAPEELARRLLAVLTKLYIPSRQDDMVRRVLGELTDAQYSVMQILAERGQVRVSDLAKAEDVAVPTMSIAIRRLVRRGWARRPAASDDKRTLLVELTARGAAAFEASARSRRARLQAWIGALSARDREALTAGVEVLGRMAGGKDDETDRITAPVSGHRGAMCPGSV